MKKQFMAVFCVGVFSMVAEAANASTFVPVDLSGVANSTYSMGGMINGHTYPTGNLTFAGIPFSINSSGNNIWHSSTAAGGNTGIVSVDIPVNIYGVDLVYTLISTWWGENSTGEYASIEFFGSDNGYFKVELDGNKHIRDYNYNPSYTTNFDPNWTKEVWNNGRGQHLDMQTFDLPDTFNNKFLLSIKLTDSGAPSFQRSFIGGVTVAPVPLPGAFWLLGSGLAGLIGAGMKRRKKI